MKFKVAAEKAANITPNLTKRGGLPLLPRDGAYVCEITSWDAETDKGGQSANDWSCVVVEAPDGMDPAKCLNVTLNGTFWHASKFAESPDPGEQLLRWIKAALPDEADKAVKDAINGELDPSVWGPRMVGTKVGVNVRTSLGENKSTGATFAVTNAMDIGTVESARKIGTHPYAPKVGQHLELAAKYAAASGPAVFGSKSNGAGAAAVATAQVSQDALAAALDG